jgi:hypothetical protein
MPSKRQPGANGKCRATTKAGRQCVHSKSSSTSSLDQTKRRPTFDMSALPAQRPPAPFY